RSRAVLGGQAGEQVAPFLPHFPCNPADARFIGKPVDFIAFPGAAEGKALEEILLIEVKSGDSQLSTRERQIRDAVKDGRVRYIQYRI
ncbi:MAG: Holliday junction resolvase, partial [Treponema sp.]|nr:Holliday junction resolvase [Treponema sp.]